ncbi:hypothetical protein M0R04_16200 [Candidatus Dojkabacteria bacterium]|nr:hypothetical protein [Candidatus Dojkabacteria bacterium]
MEQICGNCNWFRMPMCIFNPQTIKKASNDTCSHWTPKILNEVKNDKL